MAKKVITTAKMMVPGGAATPAPPVGSVLGQHGVDTQAFVTQFNDRTQDMRGSIVPVVVTIYDDRSFDFITKQPPAAVMIKEALKLQSGSGVPNKNKVGKLTKSQLKSIAEAKMSDLNTDDVNQAMKIIAGTAKQMGVEIEK